LNLQLDFSLYKDKIRENYMDKEDHKCMDWGKLGRDVSIFFSAVPQVQFMYGRLDVVAKPKAPRKKRAREEVHEETQPEKADGKAEAKVSFVGHLLASFASFAHLPCLVVREGKGSAG
jgi:hypothetical protein